MKIKDKHSFSPYDLEGNLKNIAEYINGYLDTYGEDATIEYNSWDDEDPSFDVIYERDMTQKEIIKFKRKKEREKKQRAKDKAQKEENEKKLFDKLNKKYGKGQ